jgi:hypothetical protein
MPPGQGRLAGDLPPGEAFEVADAARGRWAHLCARLGGRTDEEIEASCGRPVRSARSTRSAWSSGLSARCERVPFTITEQINFATGASTFTATGPLCPSGTFADDVKVFAPSRGSPGSDSSGGVNLLIRTPRPAVRRGRHPRLPRHPESPAICGLATRTRGVGRGHAPVPELCSSSGMPPDRAHEQEHADREVMPMGQRRLAAAPPVAANDPRRPPLPGVVNTLPGPGSR